MPTMKELGLDKLTADERLALADELWASAGRGPPGSTLTDAKRAELDRRIAEADANPDDYVTAEEMFAAARARLAWKPAS